VKGRDRKGDRKGNVSANACVIQHFLHRMLRPTQLRANASPRAGRLRHALIPLVGAGRLPAPYQHLHAFQNPAARCLAPRGSPSHKTAHALRQNGSGPDGRPGSTHSSTRQESVLPIYLPKLAARRRAGAVLPRLRFPSDSAPQSCSAASGRLPALAGTCIATSLSRAAATESHTPYICSLDHA